MWSKEEIAAWAGRHKQDGGPFIREDVRIHIAYAFRSPLIVDADAPDDALFVLEVPGPADTVIENPETGETAEVPGTFWLVGWISGEAAKRKQWLQFDSRRRFMVYVIPQEDLYPIGRDCPPGWRIVEGLGWFHEATGAVPGRGHTDGDAPRMAIHLRPTGAADRH